MSVKIWGFTEHVVLLTLEVCLNLFTRGRKKDVPAIQAVNSLIFSRAQSYCILTGYDFHCCGCSHSESPFQFHEVVNDSMVNVVHTVDGRNPAPPGIF